MFLKKRTPVRKSGWPTGGTPTPQIVVALPEPTMPAKVTYCLSCGLPSKATYCPGCRDMLGFPHPYPCERCGERPAERAIAFEGESEEFLCSFCARVRTTHV